MRNFLGLVWFVLFFAIVLTWQLKTDGPLYLQGQRVEATEYLDPNPHGPRRLRYEFNGQQHEALMRGDGSATYDGQKIEIAVDPDHPENYVVWTSRPLLTMTLGSLVIAGFLTFALSRVVRGEGRSLFLDSV